MRLYSISNLGRTARVTVFCILAVLGNLLLGSTYFPTLNYFWGIGVGRVLLALLLLFVPNTTGGRYRPGLSLLLLATLLWSFADGAHATWIPVTLAYLLLETSTDALVVENATEQEVPLELGFLAAARVLGLWLGLLIQHVRLDLPLSIEQWNQAIVLILFLFWIASREHQTDNLLGYRIRRAKLPVKVVMANSLHYLRQSRAILAVTNLFLFSLMAGLVAGAVLPYPLLHPSQAGQWLANLIPNLSLLALGLVIVWLTEKMEMAHQLPLVATAALCIIGYGALNGRQSLPELGGGVLLTGILLSCRAVLRETYRLEPVLRINLVVTAWTFGSLLGAFIVGENLPKLRLSLEIGCGLLSLLFGLFSLAHYRKPSIKLEDKHSRPISSERFGDRNHDFENVPRPAPRRKLPWKVQAFFNFFLINLPVTVLLSVTLAAAISFGWFVLERRATFENSVQTAVKVFRTQLFFTGFRHRLTEEMVASQRVPEDWSTFISDSFSSDGKALDDVDLWGTPYEILNRPERVVITSAGPDRTFGSSDDLTRTVPKPSGMKN